MARRTWTHDELAAMPDEAVSDRVARDVMGWRLMRDSHWYDRRGYTTEDWDWYPTISWSNAGLVIDRMLARGWTIQKFDHKGIAYVLIQMPNGITVRAWSTPAPRAICIAAILACQEWRAARRKKGAK